MRPFFLLVSALVLLILLSGQWARREPCSGGGCAAVGDQVNLCEVMGSNRSEPLRIVDKSLERRLTEQGRRLIESGQTVAANVLVKQLERESCRLKLPRPSLERHDSVELFRRAQDAVVVVASLYKCTRCTRWHAGKATGFAITSHGAIVTNHHVVDDPGKRTIVVMTADQRVFPVEEVLAASRSDDLAILRISTDDLQPLPIATTSAAAPVGTEVSVVSHPDGRFYCYTSGIISRYTKTRSAGRQVDAVSITADYARGSSGAPVLNRYGQVVAIVRSTDSVYYTENGRHQADLQMVFKTCIPSKSLTQLIRTVEEDSAKTTPLAVRGESETVGD